MLEILFLVRFVRRLSAIAREKGHPGTWGALGVLLWFGGEVLGFILGVAATDDVGGGAYLLALLCAATGAFIAYLVVKNLPSRAPDYAGAGVAPGGPVALPTEPPDLSNPYAPPRTR